MEETKTNPRPDLGQTFSFAQLSGDMNLLAEAADFGESCRLSRGFMATPVAAHNRVTVNTQKELGGLVAAGVGVVS